MAYHVHEGQPPAVPELAPLIQPTVLPRLLWEL